MANKITVTLEGGDELVAALRELGMGVRAEVRRATVAGAEVIRDQARALAPGPHVEVEVVSATQNGAQVDIGPDQAHWYYRFFETGAAPHEIVGKPLLALEGGAVVRRVSHPGMAAAPFLRPAHDASQGEATDAMGAVLRQRIESVRA